MNIIEGSLSCPNSKIAINISRFNKFINNQLLSGALDVLFRIGNVKENNIFIVWVPGAYELPIATNALAKSKKYDAIITIGTIIRGNTPHFNYIANACSSKLSEISIRENIPISFGILTTDNIEQAIERSGLKKGNKGSEAAITAIEMINILKLINK